MDVAVSSGITTVEWSNRVKADNISHTMIAGDLAIDGVLLTVGCPVAILWQDHGHPLAIQIGRRSLYLQRPGAIRLITEVLDPSLRALSRAVTRRRMAPREAPPARGAIRVRTVQLISRQLALDPAVRIVRDDATRQHEILAQVMSAGRRIS